VKPEMNRLEINPRSALNTGMASAMTHATIVMARTRRIQTVHPLRVLV
jgi:hypothetical protein